MLSGFPDARTAHFKKVVGLSGLEPPTSRLSGVRSNQLSYKPASVCRQHWALKIEQCLLPKRFVFLLPACAGIDLAYVEAP